MPPESTIVRQDHQGSVRPSSPNAIPGGLRLRTGSPVRAAASVPLESTIVRQDSQLADHTPEGLASPLRRLSEASPRSEPPTSEVGGLRDRVEVVERRFRHASGSLARDLAALTGEVDEMRRQTVEMLAKRLEAQEAALQEFVAKEAAADELRPQVLQRIEKLEGAQCLAQKCFQALDRGQQDCGAANRSVLQRMEQWEDAQREAARCIELLPSGDATQIVAALAPLCQQAASTEQSMAELWERLRGAGAGMEEMSVEARLERIEARLAAQDLNAKVASELNEAALEGLQNQAIDLAEVGSRLSAAMGDMVRQNVFAEVVARIDTLAGGGEAQRVELRGVVDRLQDVDCRLGAQMQEMEKRFERISQDDAARRSADLAQRMDSLERRLEGLDDSRSMNEHIDSLARLVEAGEANHQREVGHLRETVTGILTSLGDAASERQQEVISMSGRIDDIAASVEDLAHLLAQGLNEFEERWERGSRTAEEAAAERGRDLHMSVSSSLHAIEDEVGSHQEKLRGIGERLEDLTEQLEGHKAASQHEILEQDERICGVLKVVEDMASNQRQDLSFILDRIEQLMAHQGGADGDRLQEIAQLRAQFGQPAECSER